MKLRSVEIKGYVKEITHAVELVYDCLEKQAYTVEDYDKQIAVSIDSSSLTQFFCLTETNEQIVDQSDC